MKAVGPHAYANYLKGRYVWNQRTADGLKKTIDYFNLVIASQPTVRVTALADCYALLEIGNIGNIR